MNYGDPVIVKHNEEEISGYFVAETFKPPTVTVSIQQKGHPSHGLNKVFPTDEVSPATPATVTMQTAAQPDPAIDAKLADLSARLAQSTANLSGSISTLNSQVSSAQTSISGLLSRVAALEADVAALKAAAVAPATPAAPAEAPAPEEAQSAS